MKEGLIKNILRTFAKRNDWYQFLIEFETCNDADTANEKIRGLIGGNGKNLTE